MAEDITIVHGNRQQQYQSMLPQIKALIEGETDLIANLANISSALKTGMGFFWVGFYLVKNNELVLGPFQGSPACTRIGFGKGVCGTSWKENKTLIVDDVDAFPGHIACSSLSRSEITVPLYSGSGNMVGILDVDSDKLADFNETDKIYLEELATMIKPLFS
jgi:L-methionine (R)-S-oxide reductase